MLVLAERSPISLEYAFIKLQQRIQKEYGISDTFSLRSRQNNLYDVLQILKQIRDRFAASKMSTVIKHQDGLLINYKSLPLMVFLFLFLAKGIDQKDYFLKTHIHCWESQ